MTRRARGDGGLSWDDKRQRWIAAVTVGWWALLPCLLAVPPVVIGLRWYLARAKDGYLAETASYSQITTTLSETVEGSRTVEALGLGAKRVELGDDDCAKSFEAEKYTLHLRTVFFPAVEVSYLIPTVATLLFGPLARGTEVSVR